MAWIFDGGFACNCRPMKICTVLLLLLCIRFLLSRLSSILRRHGMSACMPSGQANEAIFITSFAAESNINFQFSECHLAWLTDIINRKCTENTVNKFNFPWIRNTVCTHVFGYCFFRILFLLVIVFRFFFHSLVHYSHYYAINHPFVRLASVWFICAKTGRNDCDLWQIQWKCHLQCYTSIYKVSCD